MKYTIAGHSDLIAFIDKVQTYISIGWEPQGGVTTVIAGGTVFFYQAMTKKDTSHN